MAKDKTLKSPPESDDKNGVGRRDFLKITTASAGLIALGSRDANGDEPKRFPSPAIATAAKHDVVVVGAGLWGSYTAYHLRRKGAKVTLVDQFGPGNSRATSGDETRGVRSTYGDRESGELWMLWAREAMQRWTEFDKEWSKYWKMQVFFETGDLCFRATPDDPIIKRTREWYDKHKIHYEMLSPADVKKTWPVIRIDGIPDVADITHILYEKEAGVLRARRAAQYGAAALEKLGGTVKIGRVNPIKGVGGKLDGIQLDTGEKIIGDTYVFALGPWHRTFFPELLGDRMRTPLASVCYFATPPGDERFTYPNMPSYNFPGTTGWVALPIDNRGFRVRGGAGRAPGAAGAPGTGGTAGTGAAAGTAGTAGTGGQRGD
ncbi:MAG TPA: FAD-dependent oxidoreductase [Gemmatimonadaceae bacterium]|nr:FAD-dependent oxidoreductase [Gemmatimonadaceae bacterium]